MSRFFNVLIHRLAASLADSGTEVNFAWSLPADCNWGAIQLIIAACKTLTLSVSLLRADSFTAMYYNQKIFHCKEAERLTYTFLALPAWPSSWICYSSESPHSIDQQVLERRIVRGLAKAFAVALEFSLCVGFLLVDRAPTYKPSNKALPADTGTTEIKQ